MRSYFIFLVILLLFGGCSQKFSSQSYRIESSDRDIQDLDSEIDNSESMNTHSINGYSQKFPTVGSSCKALNMDIPSIIGKVSFEERYESKKKYRKQSKISFDERYDSKENLLQYYREQGISNISLIKAHSYQTVNSKNELKKLNNTMTYVLFPRNLMGQNKKTKKYKRYAKVLELIQELKKVNNSTHLNKIKKYENKFILPKIKSLNEEKVTVETYNYKLSNVILDFFKEKITPLFFDKDGPFFITVTKNVFNQEKISSFIYLDLSTFNESAINQVVNSYKHRLVEKGNDNIGILEEWHYKILSAITNFNDNLHLFQVALVGEK